MDRFCCFKADDLFSYPVRMGHGWGLQKAGGDNQGGEGDGSRLL